VKTVHIPAKREYDIYIEHGLLDRCGEIIAQKRAEELFDKNEGEGALLSPGKLCIVTDKTVESLYIEELRVSCIAGGFKVCNFVIEGGENSKLMTNAQSLAEFLGEMGFTKDDLIAGLGGGVVLDLAGFTASFYREGIDYVQIPTTVTAALTSTVSGRSYINLIEGKNLGGASIDPLCVIVDPGCFDTLPSDVYHAGLAEAVKNGIVSDRYLFEGFELGSFDIEESLAKSIAISARYIYVREEDARLLRLGYPVANAIQRASGYEISRGDALAIGLYVTANATGSVKLAERIYRTLALTGLPWFCDIAKEEILMQLPLDQSAANGMIDIVVPLRIGECEVRTMTIDEAKEFLAKGFNEGQII
jgi:3-dehydroquinate synthase